MFDTIGGLPVHALVVHAVIVLLPLACLGAIAIALRPAWSRTYGLLVVVCALIATGSAAVAKQSGEALASRVGYPADHASIARWTPVFAFLLLVSVTLLWWWDRTQLEGRATLTKVAAVATLVFAVIALGWVVAAGHSGATTVWGPIVANTTPGSLPVP
jgi:uncharacterized membrane protein